MNLKSRLVHEQHERRKNVVSILPKAGRGILSLPQSFTHSSKKRSGRGYKPRPAEEFKDSGSVETVGTGLQTQSRLGQWAHRNVGHKKRARPTGLVI